MALMKIRYLVRRPKANGTDRYYWQPDGVLRTAGWKMRRLSDDMAAAMVEAEQINTLVDEWRAGKTGGPVNENPGTVDAIIAAYKKSRYFTSKAKRTQQDYKVYLRLISDWAGKEPAIMINAKMVADLYEIFRVKSPRKAMYVIQVARLLFSYAENQSIIPKNTNPFTRQRLEYKAAKGRIWSHDDVAHFVATADMMGYADIGTAVMLNEWLGQRRGDILRLSMRAYRDGVLLIRQGKTGAEVSLPVDMVPELKHRIDMQVAANKKKATVGTTLIQQQNGKPYSDDGFMSAFERIRAQAGKLNKNMATLVFKDLRHTAVTRLAESGAEIPMIASVTGHTFKSCQDIIDRYNIRTTKMAREAFSRRLMAEGNTP